MASQRPAHLPGSKARAPPQMERLEAGALERTAGGLGEYLAASSMLPWTLLSLRPSHSLLEICATWAPGHM